MVGAVARRTWPQAVWIVRHGESVANIALQEAVNEGQNRVELVTRDADVPLSALGERQARAAGEWFRGLPEDQRPERILSSPFRRARQTADLIVRTAGLEVDVATDERLRERDLGVLEKLTHKGMKELDPQQSAFQREIGKFYHRPPGGESWCDIVLRLRSLLESFVLHQDDRRVLFVCHQAVVICLRYIFEHLDEEKVLHIDRESAVANGGITEYAVADDGGFARMRLVRFNQDPTVRE